MLHALVSIVFLTVPLQAPWRHGQSTPRQGEQFGDTLMFVLGTHEFRAKGPTVQHAPRDSTASARAAAAAGVGATALTARSNAATPAAATPNATTAPTIAAAPPPPAPPEAASISPPDPLAAAATHETSPTMPAYDPDASRVALAPQVGDGRLWVSPRPGLPLAVAEALYGDTTGRNEAAMARLRSMVDSLNQVLDQIQREHKLPSWVVGGTPDKPAWGIDPKYIHIAGIKIPTAALALLGQFLPQGNYDEGLRARQLAYMREDLMQAAARAQSFQQFRAYVHELRERKQAERDAEERRRAQDTVRAVP